MNNKYSFKLFSILYFTKSLCFIKLDLKLFSYQLHHLWIRLAPSSMLDSFHNTTISNQISFYHSLLGIFRCKEKYSISHIHSISSILLFSHFIHLLYFSATFSTILAPDDLASFFYL